ncbi:hypothetical protein KRMM14A1259_10670 [Krasilnikovia sp. MM14-A1259]
MRRLALGSVVAALLAAGSAEAVPTPTTATAACPTSLVVVAHQDDDLLFINPDVSRDIAAGRCLTTVFVTAGDAGRNRTYWRGRETGAEAAYAAMAGRPARWATDRLAVGDHTLSRATLRGTGITLLFLRLPDGRGYAKHHYETVRKLLRGNIGQIHAIDGSATYTARSLTDTLTAIMNIYQPAMIRTLDYIGEYGDGDHGDHHSAAYLTYAAHLAYRTTHRISGYQGYRIADRPVNLSPEDRDTKLRYFLAYAPHDPRVCQAEPVCMSSIYGPRFARRYSVGSEAGGDNARHDPRTEIMPGG